LCFFLEPQAIIINAHLESDSEASENEIAQHGVQAEHDGYQLLSTDPNGANDNEGAVDETVANETENGSQARWSDLEFEIPHQPRWESVDLDAGKPRFIGALQGVGMYTEKYYTVLCKIGVDRTGL
jgi:hypothetical protein